MGARRPTPPSGLLPYYLSKLVDGRRRPTPTLPQPIPPATQVNFGGDSFRSSSVAHGDVDVFNLSDKEITARVSITVAAAGDVAGDAAIELLMLFPCSCS